VCVVVEGARRGNLAAVLRDAGRPTPPAAAPCTAKPGSRTSSGWPALVEQPAGWRSQHIKLAAQGATHRGGVAHVEQLAQQVEAQGAALAHPHQRLRLQRPAARRAGIGHRALQPAQLVEQQQGAVGVQHHRLCGRRGRRLLGGRAGEGGWRLAAPAWLHAGAWHTRVCAGRWRHSKRAAGGEGGGEGAEGGGPAGCSAGRLRAPEPCTWPSNSRCDCCSAVLSARAPCGACAADQAPGQVDQADQQRRCRAVDPGSHTAGSAALLGCSPRASPAARAGRHRVECRLCTRALGRAAGSRFRLRRGEGDGALERSRAACDGRLLKQAPNALRLHIALCPRR
jgi:hypothetical protein